MHGDHRYPVEPDFCRALPSIRAVLIDPFKCYSCLGTDRDIVSGEVGCPVCRGQREIFELWVDLAWAPPRVEPRAAAWPRARADAYASVIARVRSPWPLRDGWYTDPPVGQECGMALDVVVRVIETRADLERVMFRAASCALAAQGGLLARSLEIAGELPDVLP